MKVGLTGATGLLGGNVAHAARRAGHAVVCTRRAGSRADHLADLDLRWIEADLGAPDTLARAFQGCELVVHCAARTSVLPRPTPGLVRDNVEGTQTVLQACAQIGARLVHVSSTVAVGLSEDGQPCDETSPWNLPAHGLDDGYATTKRAAELLVQAAARDGQVDAVIVNPGFLFGPLDARPSSGRMLLEVAAGRAVVATGGRNCFVDARRVADGVLAAGARGQVGERYILGGENLSYAQIFARIAAIVGRGPPRWVIPRWVAQPAGWCGDLVQAATGREQAITSTTVAWGAHPGFVFRSDRAQTELGWEPGDLDEGLRAAWAWFRDTGRA